jgi:hypothetical protein
VITKVAPRGSRLAGLVAYLYGRGSADEHVNPHLVAAWDPTLLDEANAAQVRAGRAALVADMSSPRQLFGVEVPRGHVYHVAISLSPAERALGTTPGGRWPNARRSVWGSSPTRTLGGPGAGGSRSTTACRRPNAITSTS